mmetsp:Transcript_2309/g.5442  ORF Transcript_2309/g.5442 Transcript_2309/m.5442 type:complete len:280 (-) Transcript_2309:1156-1995(-)
MSGMLDSTCSMPLCVAQDTTAPSKGVNHAPQMLVLLVKFVLAASLVLSRIHRAHLVHRHCRQSLHGLLAANGRATRSTSNEMVHVLRVQCVETTKQKRRCARELRIDSASRARSAQRTNIKCSNVQDPPTDLVPPARFARQKSSRRVPALSLRIANATPATRLHSASRIKSWQAAGPENAGAVCVTWGGLLATTVRPVPTSTSAPTKATTAMQAMLCAPTTTADSNAGATLGILRTVPRAWRSITACPTPVMPRPAAWTKPLPARRGSAHAMWATPETA